MTIIQKKTADLIPYEKNPRKNDEAVEKVAASIREFGFKVPIVIDKDNVIVAGHTRLKAALAAGINEVPCIVADDLTEEQIKAFRLADNKTAELSTWDFELLADELQDINDIDMSEFGFDFSEIGEEEEIIEDDYDFKENVEHRASAGDIFQLGDHRLMCGDSSSAEDVEKLSGGCEPRWSSPIRRMESQSATRTRCSKPFSALDDRPRTSSGTLWVLKNCTNC